MENKNKKNYRLNQRPYSFYMPNEIFDEVKAMSEMQGIPIKTYILKALIRNLNLEKEKKIHIESKKCLHV